VRVRKSEEKRVKEAKRGVAVYGRDKIGEFFFSVTELISPFFPFVFFPHTVLFSSTPHDNRRLPKSVDCAEKA